MLTGGHSHPLRIGSKSSEVIGAVHSPVELSPIIGRPLRLPASPALRLANLYRAVLPLNSQLRYPLSSHMHAATVPCLCTCARWVLDYSWTPLVQGIIRFKPCRYCRHVVTKSPLRRMLRPVLSASSGPSLMSSRGNQLR